jgi:hypothetical protein
MLPSLEIEITADPKAAEAGLSRLGKSITALDAATSNYQKELSRVDAALKANLTTQTGAAAAVKQAEANYKTATAAAVKYSGATVAFSRAQVGAAGTVRKFGGEMRGAGSHTANLGAQFNDIGVMLAAGQNPLQLALQQGTQINQVFAQMGSGREVLGGLGAAFKSMINPMSLATLGLIAGGAALVQWGMSALGASEESKALDDRMTELKATSAALNTELRGLRLGVTLDELTLMDAITVQREKMAGLEERIANARSGSGYLEAFTKELEIEKQNLSVIEGQLSNMRQQRAERETLLHTIREMSDQERMLGEQMQEVGQQTEETNRMADLLKAGISATVLEAMQLAGIDMASPVEAAAIQAGILATNLGVSLERAMQIEALGKVRPMGRPMDLNTNDSGAPGAGIRPPMRPMDLGDSSKIGGGGSSAVNPLIGDIESLKEALATETETIMITRQEQLEMLQEAFAQRIITQEEFQDLSLRSAQEHAEAMANLDKAEQKAKLDAYAGMFSDISGLMQSENKKLFAIGKAAAIASAIVNGYSAAVAAWDKGMKVGGPPVAAAFTAASLAKTGALISGISSQQIGSSAGGAVSAGGGAAAGGEAAAPPRQNTTITLVGNVFSGDTVADMLNEFADRGGRLQENIIVRRG